MLEHIFKSFLITSCIGTALGALLILLRPITKKLFPSAWHYYMWISVMVVMILPVRFILPQKPLQPQPQIAVSAVSEVNRHAEIVSEPAQVQIPSDTPRIKLQSDYRKLTSFVTGRVLSMAFLWLAVAGILILSKIVRYILFLIILRRGSQTVECPELAAFTEKRIAVRKVRGISSPLMLGIFKPTLVLPATELTKEQLNNILSHEIVHFKRRDIALKWFTSLVKCIHWFNPAVYYISRQADIECEISCDMSVVKHMTKEQELSYVNTILTLLSDGASKTVPLTTGMTGNKELLKRRFTMIKNKTKFRRKIVIISIIAALVILTVTVFASGLINGRLLGLLDDKLLQLNTDPRGTEGFNCLLVGVDETGRADTIAVLAFNKNSITGVSIPRDTSFSSQDGSALRISDILNKDNGDQLVVDAVRNKLSIPITYYARINLSAVENLIDCVGNLEIDVPLDMSYDDPASKLHINLKKGRQSLDGKQVCNLLRFRRSNDGGGYTDGDMTRMEIGQQVIKEFIVQKLTKENLDKAPDIYKILSQNLATNYSFKSISDDIGKIPDLKKNMEFYTLPGKPTTIDGIMLYEVDFNKAENILQLFGYKKEVGSVKKQENEVAFKQGENTSEVTETQETIKNTGDITIKSTTMSDELYLGFEQLSLINANSEKIQNELIAREITQSSKQQVDLTKNYALRDLEHTESCVKADENGNISLYFEVNGDNLFEVDIYDSETNTDVGQYIVLANSENAYTFLGFEKGREYTVAVINRTKGDWNIEGNYIIY